MMDTMVDEVDERASIDIGDVVKLTRSMSPQEFQDADGVTRWLALAVMTHEKCHRLFDCQTGIYLGPKYVATLDRRAKVLGGRVQKMMQAFLFGQHEVFMEPDNVTVVSRVADATG